MGWIATIILVLVVGFLMILWSDVPDGKQMEKMAKALKESEKIWNDDDEEEEKSTT